MKTNDWKQKIIQKIKKINFRQEIEKTIDIFTNLWRLIKWAKDKNHLFREIFKMFILKFNNRTIDTFKKKIDMFKNVFFQHHHRSIWSTFRSSFILIRSNVFRALRKRKFLRSLSDLSLIKSRVLTTSSTNCSKHALSSWSNCSHLYSRHAFNCFIIRRRSKNSTRSLWKKRKKMFTSFRRRIDS